MTVPLLQSTSTVNLAMSGRKLQATMRLSSNAAQGLVARSSGLWMHKATPMAARIFFLGAYTFPIPSGWQFATAVPFDAVNCDYGGAGTITGMTNIAAQPTRITCQLAGYYAIGGSCFANTATAGNTNVRAWIQKNGAGSRIGQNSVSAEQALTVAGGQVNAVEFLNVGDYIELYCALVGPAADPGDLRFIGDAALYASLVSE